MPSDKRSVNFRLSEAAQRRLLFLARTLEGDKTGVVELALKHLYGSIIRDENLHLRDQPPEAAGGGQEGAA